MCTDSGDRPVLKPKSDPGATGQNRQKISVEVTRHELQF